MKAAGIAVVEGEKDAAAVLEEADKGGEVVLDWKGDPMTINPGDKFPFKFY